MRVLIFDIETSPIVADVWGLWENNVSLNQIRRDWFVLSYAAKWLDQKKVFYEDQSKAKDITNDKQILKGVWKLLDESDIVITQNGKAFDQKKLNARFVIHGFKPPSSFKHIDTKILAKKHFGFTSNSLEYMTDKLCTKYKKLKHKKFPGHEMWTECLKGNPAAWREMKKYNIHDVLALEELYKKLIPWDNSVNFRVYGDVGACTCGNGRFMKYGYAYTGASKFQRYKCNNCGSETRGRQNLLDRSSLKVGTLR